MTTIPVDLGWLIVAVFILTPALCFLATVEANHFYTRAYRKDMKRQKFELSEGWRRLVVEREKLYEDLSAEREEFYDERRTERRKLADERQMLGRAAHDAATQTRAALYQANVDDTVIAMPRLEL